MNAAAGLQPGATTSGPAAARGAGDAQRYAKDARKLLRAPGAAESAGFGFARQELVAEERWLFVPRSLWKGDKGPLDEYE